MPRWPHAVLSVPLNGRFDVEAVSPETVGVLKALTLRELSDLCSMLLTVHAQDELEI
jgi:hypothetical protein